MTHIDRRQAVRLLAGLGVGGALAPVLTACGSDSTNSDEELNRVTGGPPVRIGMVVPQSGRSKPLGDEMANGFRLYVNLNNELLGGRKVELIAADEGETPQSGLEAANKLLKQDRVDALTGVVNPAVMLAIRDTVEASQVPLLGSNASPSTLQGAKYIWRTSFVGSEPGLALSRWMADNIRGPVAVMAAESQSNEEARAFIQALQDAKGTLAGEPVYTPVSQQTTNFAPHFARVKGFNAAALFAFYGTSAAVDLVKAYKAAAFPSSFRMFAPGAVTEGFVLKQHGDAARGIYTAMNYSPDLDNAANRRFAAEYQKAYAAVPSTFAMASYDAAAVLDRALASIGADLTPVSLNASIGRLGQIESPRGSWQFNQTRSPLQKWYLRQVRMDGSVLSNVLTAELTTLG